MRPQLPAGIGTLGAVVAVLAVTRPLGLAVGAPVDPVPLDPATGPTTPPASTVPTAPTPPAPTDPAPAPAAAPDPAPVAPAGGGGAGSQAPADPAPARQEQAATVLPVVADPQASTALQAVPVANAKGDLWLTQIAASIGQRRLGYGRDLAIVGFLPSKQADVALTLQFRQRRGKWTALAVGRSGPGGTYRFVVPAIRSGAVRVIVTGSNGDRRLGAGSAAHAVLIEPDLRAHGIRGSILRTSRATVTGRLRGAGSRRVVVLQRRAGRRWYTVARGRTMGDGIFRLRYLPRRPGRGTLRVRFPGDTDLASAQTFVGWRGRGGLLGAVGRVVLRPGANALGRPMTARLMRFITLMSEVFGAQLVVTTGTNHSTWTSTGGVSDHVSGNAADFGVSENHGAGDRIAAAALVVAGLPPREAIARARRGGLINVVRRGIRVQVIWKTWLGGNHFSHVHVGVRPLR